MAIVIPTGFAQASFLYALENDSEMMFTTCGLSPSTVDPDPQTVAELLADGWHSSFPNGGSLDQWTFKGCRLRMGLTGGVGATYEAVRTEQGALGSDGPPSNFAILVKKVTALGGRSQRGRWYLPPFACREVDVNARGILTPGVVGSFQTSMDDVFALAEWWLLHDSTAPSTVPTPITAFVVEEAGATQRRRMRR